MKTLILIFALSMAIFACTSKPLSTESARRPQAELSQGTVFFERVTFPGMSVTQRTVMMLESKDVAFKGCVMYLEGFGDSVQNHYPLFNKIRNAGYRVISFDYLGQGGSEGSMSDMRVYSGDFPMPTSKDYEIGYQARALWQAYSQYKDPVYNRDCSQSAKRVIGWSTGGLAAYKLAHEKWADGYVLIAPGIVPNLCVGTTATNCLTNFTESKVVTLPTLTRNRFDAYTEPHLDPIKPTALLSNMMFAINLVVTSYDSRDWKFGKDTKALVFLSSWKDTYININDTIGILHNNAPWFKIITYKDSLHEIDNELPEISDDMHARTIEFLDSIVSPKALGTK